MLNLVVKKGASKDRDRSGSSISRPRIGTPIGFAKRSRLYFVLGTSPYTVDILMISITRVFRRCCVLISCNKIYISLLSIM